MKNPFTAPWTPDRLMSRKFGLATLYVIASMATDIAGRPMNDATLTSTRDVILAYLAAQGLVDWRRTKALTDFETGADMRSTTPEV